MLNGFGFAVDQLVSVEAIDYWVADETYESD